MSLKTFQMILDKIIDYHVDENLCTSLISPKDSCRACAEACPLSCISITDGISIDNECVSCGICSAKCKTGAIKMKLSASEAIYYKIESGESVLLGCRKDNAAKDAYFEKFCLGGLNDEMILYLLLRTPQVLREFDSTKCRKCDFASGYYDFERRKKRIEERLDNINLKDKEKFRMKPERKTPQECDYDKRALLNFILHPGKVFEESEQKKEKDMHQVFRGLLTFDKSLYLVSDYIFPKKQQDCSNCGACAKLCPSKALERRPDGVYLNIKLCSGCGLCEKVCYDKSIKLEKISFEDFNRAEIKVI